jgi:hypothetical protein
MKINKMRAKQGMKTQVLLKKPAGNSFVDFL